MTDTMHSSEAAPSTVPLERAGDEATDPATPAVGVVEPGPSGSAPVEPDADTGAPLPAPPDEPPPPPAAELARIADLQVRTLEELGRLGEAFSLKIKFDEAKERAIDTLNEEVQRHRQGLHFSILRPLFLDLITLHDDLLQCAGAAAGDASTTRTFASLADTVQEILARNGVESFGVDGDAFDGKRQRTIRTAPTEDAAEAGRVAHRLRQGFEYDGRVLRPEHVATYRLAERQAAPEPVPDPEPAPQPSEV
jgi:molecular chaperone GrpE